MKPNHQRVRECREIMEGRGDLGWTFWLAVMIVLGIIVWWKC